MKQCELEKLTKEKGQHSFKRTGIKMVTFIEDVTQDMLGTIIDLKKVDGSWIIDKINDQEIETHQIKRSWHVGGL